MEKIDIVYLWCDGNDIEFRKRKNSFMNKTDTTVGEKSTGELRFFDNEELRYSLRSLEQNAPWINHVFIVTDRQVPRWLNLDCKKVSIVDHSMIMPKEIIPCFNTCVLEQFLAFIPGLSEKFLYANDDMFFGRKVKTSDFFLGNKPIVRLKKIREHEIKQMVNVNGETEYQYSYPKRNAINLIKQEYGKENFYEMHHNIDAYTKSSFIATYKKFKHHLDKTIKYRFRNNECVQRLLFNLDLIYSDKGILKIVDNPKPWRRHLHFILPVEWESYVDSENGIKTHKIIQKYKPKLFCINSGESCSSNEKIKNKQFMEMLFPNKSKFEK